MNLILESFILVCLAYSALAQGKVSITPTDKLSIDIAFTNFQVKHSKRYDNSSNQAKRLFDWRFYSYNILI